MSTSAGPGRRGSAAPTDPAEVRAGLGYGVGAYAMWGLVPLYWPLLDPASPPEVLAHRIVWTLLVVLVLLSVTRRWHTTRTIGWRRLGLLAAAAVVISVNWGTFIYGVSIDQVLEVSLGYFINPLVTIVLAVVVLGETLRRAQWAAVAVALVGVVVLTVDYGRPPWIALVLAGSFAVYGLLKKQANVGAVESLGVETFVLLLPATGYLLWLQAAGEGRFGQVDLGTDLLFVGAGVVTAIPLLFFGAAATRIPLATLGLLQYIGPTLQFVIGLVVFGETVTPIRLVGFALVWAALVVFTVESVRHRRRTLRLTAAACPT